MRLLLLLILLSSGVCSPPAPEGLFVSSVNFRYKLCWKPGPGSAPNLTYFIYINRCCDLSDTCSCSECVNSVNTMRKCTHRTLTSDLCTEVKLRPYYETYSLCVRSSSNCSVSAPSKTVTFTPDTDTVVTAPRVQVWGGGRGLWVNVSLPSPHRGSGIRDLRKVFSDLKFKVFCRRSQGQATEDPLIMKNQTFLIQNLLADTEYCVQVQPWYLDITFLPSPWQCAFTSIPPPPPVLSVPWAVVSVVLLLVLLLSGLILLIFGLHYTGVLGKIREVLPRSLTNGLGQSWVLRLESTVLEPVSLLPGTQPLCDEDEEDEEDEEDDDEEEDEPQRDSQEQYMNRDLSDSSSRAGHVTSRDQSAETVSDQAEHPEDTRAGLHDTRAGLQDTEEELEDDVDLFSVTVAALTPQYHQGAPDQCGPFSPDDNGADECGPDECGPDQCGSELSVSEGAESEELSLNCYLRH